MRAYFPEVVIFAFALTGCEIDGSDNLPPVSDQGLVMYAEANRHEAEVSAQVAAAVFNNGESVSLVGGDVFEARTATDRVLLTKAGYYDGTYAESLPVDNSVQEVFFNIVHEPVEARADRWYPVDLLNIDPGPGELVGKSAMVTFPQPVTINTPVADTVYTDINDVIDFDWISGNGDNMRVLAAIECSDGLATSSYGAVVDIAGDSGFETISMDKFIYDLNTEFPAVEFIRDAALVLLQELLNDLSAGNIDPDFLTKKANANPIESSCEIRLFLQRQLPGQFDDVAFDDGTVVGSTSAEVTVIYLPEVVVNQ